MGRKKSRRSQRGDGDGDDPEKNRPEEPESAPDTKPEAAPRSDNKGAAENAANASERKAVRDLEEQVKELTDRLQRKTAEFANYQKRMQKEMDDARRFAAGPLALELLSVLDSFERALGSGAMSGSENGNDAGVEPGREEAGPGTSRENESVLQGIRLIYEQLRTALANQGITPIEALKAAFDPNLHDAIMEEENPDLPDKTVIDELVKGYMLHDRLLRPARVRVSRIPRPEEKTEEERNAGEEDGTGTDEEDRADGPDETEA